MEYNLKFTNRTERERARDYSERVAFNLTWTTAIDIIIKFKRVGTYLTHYAGIYDFSLKDSDMATIFSGVQCV